MADLEQARSMLRMAYKDFNALTGIIAMYSGLNAEVR